MPPRMHGQFSLFGSLPQMAVVLLDFNSSCPDDMVNRLMLPHSAVLLRHCYL